MSSKSLAPSFFISEVLVENLLIVSRPKAGTNRNLRSTAKYNMSPINPKLTGNPIRLTVLNLVHLGYA